MPKLAFLSDYDDQLLSLNDFKLEIDMAIYSYRKAGSIKPGERLCMNAADDAVVLSTSSIQSQTVLDIEHANGEKSTLSRLSTEFVKVRPTERT